MALLNLNAVTASLRRGAKVARCRLASEGGFAVPTVMLMTVAALGMAGVAVTTSIQGQRGTVRDQGTKTALAVAESGVSQALLHYNRGVAPCVPATEGEWCGPVTGMSVNGGEVSYWARVLGGEDCDIVDVGKCVDIVSVGTVDGVSRRVEVFASSLDDDEGTNGGPFASASVLSRDTLTLDSNAVIHTGSATNGDIELASNAKQCGPASVGVGKDMKPPDSSGYHGDALCTTPGGSVGEKELILPPVDQKDAAENNDNWRLFAVDSVTGNKQDACWDTLDADGNTPKPAKACGERELRVDQTSTVHLTGSVYSFCKLTLINNSSLVVSSGTDVTIYFDSPENCEYSSGVTQLELLSNSRITSADGDPVSIALLFVGSESLDTNILLNSNTSVDGPCDQNFVIYAPLTDIELNSKSRFCGALAGESVHLDSNAQVWAASGTEEFNLPGVEIPPTPDHYTPYRFVECSAGTPATTPNEGC